MRGAPVTACQQENAHAASSLLAKCAICRVRRAGAHAGVAGGERRWRAKLALIFMLQRLLSPNMRENVGLSCAHRGVCMAADFFSLARMAGGTLLIKSLARRREKAMA